MLVMPRYPSVIPRYLFVIPRYLLLIPRYLPVIPRYLLVIPSLSLSVSRSLSLTASYPLPVSLCSPPSSPSLATLRLAPLHPRLAHSRRPPCLLFTGWQDTPPQGGDQGPYSGGAGPSSRRSRCRGDRRGNECWKAREGGREEGGRRAI